MNKKGTRSSIKSDQGVRRSVSRGYRTTSLTFCELVITIISLSKPSPQPECGGIPQSNALRCSTKFSGFNPCSVNLALNLEGSCCRLPPETSSRYPYCKSKDFESLILFSFS